MTRTSRWLAPLLLGPAAAALSQTTPPPPPPLKEPPPIVETIGTPPAAVPAPDTVAAKVNGQPVYESAVQRSLGRFPPAKRAEVRADILATLVDNILVDQALRQVPVAVEKAEVEARVGEMRAEAKKKGQDLDAILKEMNIGPDELREVTAAELRWEKYATAQTNDKALQELFAAHKDTFDGTTVRASHILVTPKAATPEAAAAAAAEVQALRKTIEAKVVEETAKLPPVGDALAREQQRAKLLAETFAEAAKAKSDCPTKSGGGDLGWFQRAGSVVEPFAKAAFAMPVYQLSDAVTTPYGCHLILTTDRRNGKDVKFEDVKGDVQEVFHERLRQDLIAKARQTAKVEILKAN